MAFNYREGTYSKNCGCSRELLAARCQHVYCAELDSHDDIIYRHVDSPGVPPIRSGINGYDTHDNLSVGHVAPCALKVYISSMFNQCHCTDCAENNGSYYAYPTFDDSLLPQRISDWTFTTCTQAKPYAGCGYTHGKITLEAALDDGLDMVCRLYKGEGTSTVYYEKKARVGNITDYGSDFRCSDFPLTVLSDTVISNDPKCSNPTIMVEPVGEGHFVSPPYDNFAGSEDYIGSCLEAGESLPDVSQPHQTVSYGSPLYQSTHVGNFTKDVAVFITGSANGGGVSGIYACDECTRLDGAHMMLSDGVQDLQSLLVYTKDLNKFDFTSQVNLPPASGADNKFCCGNCDRPAASSMCIQELSLSLASGVQTFAVVGLNGVVMSRYTREMSMDMMNWNTLTGFTYKPDGITNPLRNQCNFKDLSLTVSNMSPVGNPIAFNCAPKITNGGFIGGAAPEAISVNFPAGHWILDVYKDIKVQALSVTGSCIGWTTPGGPNCEYARLDCGYPGIGGGPEGGFILTKGTFEYSGSCSTDYRCPRIVSYKYLSGNTTNPCEFMSIEAILYTGSLSAPTVCTWGGGSYPYGTVASAPLDQTTMPTIMAVFVRWPEWQQEHHPLCSDFPCGRVRDVHPVGCAFISPVAGFPQATYRRAMFVGPITGGVFCDGATMLDPDNFSAILNPCTTVFSNGSAGFPDAIAGWNSMGTPITAGNA